MFYYISHIVRNDADEFILKFNLRDLSDDSVIEWLKNILVYDGDQWYDSYADYNDISDIIPKFIEHLKNHKPIFRWEWKRRGNYDVYFITESNSINLSDYYPEKIEKYSVDHLIKEFKKI
jgi:hypothetical protein